MKITLNDFLVGEDFSYIFKSKKKGITRFYCHVDSEGNNLSAIDIDIDIDLDSYSDIDSYIDIKNDIDSICLKIFLEKLNVYPLYIHGISGSDEINLSNKAEMTKLSNGNYYYVVDINNIEELKTHFSEAYLDAFNNESILFSNERTLEMDFHSDIGLARFILDYTEDNYKYHLWVSHDGIGFDFISNFSDHPYQNIPVTKDEDER